MQSHPPETPGSDDLLHSLDIKAQLGHSHDIPSLSVIADVHIPDKPPVVPFVLAPSVLKNIDVGGAEVWMLQNGIKALHTTAYLSAEARNTLQPLCRLQAFHLQSQDSCDDL